MQPCHASGSFADNLGACLKPLTTTRNLPSAPSLTIALLRHVARRAADPSWVHDNTPIDAAFQQADPLFAVVINTYISYLDRALYGRREPTEEDAEAVEQLVEVIRKTADVKRRKIVEAESAEKRKREENASRDRLQRARAQDRRESVRETSPTQRKRRNTISDASLRLRKSSLFSLRDTIRDGASSPSSMGTIHRQASVPLYKDNRPRSRTISHASTSARSGVPPSILANPSGGLDEPSVRSMARARANTTSRP